jgi:hypothetical protein
MAGADKAPGSTSGKAPVRSGFLGLGLALLLFALSKAHGALGTNEEAGPPPLCSAWHRGHGDAQPIDLGRIKRSYEDLKTRLSRSVANSMKKEMEAIHLKGYDAGLPACRRSERRSFRPEGKIPPEILGKRLWFTEIKARKHLVVPELLRDDPGAIVFATRTDKFEDLAEASRFLGRPVSLASRELSQALGVRCGPAVVVISQSGEVEVHENP